MAGLDNYLATLKDNAGMAGGYQAGLQDKAGLNTTLLKNRQQEAETSRYAGETPSYLQKGQAQAESARLGNLQSQADEQAGVYGAKSQESLATARQKALEAKQAWQRMPQEQKTKMLTAVKNGQMELFDTIEQTLSQSNSVPNTIAFIEQQYPEMVNDKGWAMAKQQVSKMSPQEAMSKIRSMKASMASSDIYGSAEHQGKMQLEEMQQAGALQRAQVGAEATVTAANTRSSVEKKPTADEFLYSQIEKANPGSTPQQLADMYVKAKTVVTKETPSILSPTGIATTTTTQGVPSTSNIPDLNTFLEKAKKTNPNVSEADLIAYYHKKYGK
jgi:hypothetical protein